MSNVQTVRDNIVTIDGRGLRFDEIASKLVCRCIDKLVILTDRRYVLDVGCVKVDPDGELMNCSLQVTLIEVEDETK